MTHPPPDMRSGPASNEPAPPAIDTHADDTEHAARIVRPQQATARRRSSFAARLARHHRQRRASDELTALLRRMYPEAYAWPGPQTYGLSPDELRLHANALYVAGWTIPEILATLAVPEPADERVSA